MSAHIHVGRLSIDTRSTLGHQSVEEKVDGKALRTRLVLISISGSRVSYFRVPFLFVLTLLSESLEQATVLAVAMKQRTAKLCNFSVLLFYCNCSISKIVDLPRLLFLTFDRI